MTMSNTPGVGVIVDVAVGLGVVVCVIVGVRTGLSVSWIGVVEAVVVQAEINNITIKQPKTIQRIVRLPE